MKHLKQHLGVMTKYNKELPVHSGRYRNTFSDEQTEEFVNYVKEFSGRGFGLTRFQLRELVYEYAVAKNIPHRFNNEKKMAGRDWYLAFTKINQLSLRIPEGTSLGRLLGFNRPAVPKFSKGSKNQI